MQKQAKNFIICKALQTKPNDWITKGINYWETESQKFNFILEKTLATWSRRVLSLSEVLERAFLQWLDFLEIIDLNSDRKYRLQ